MPGSELHELWFRLARIPWASIVLVPADDAKTAADVATSLAEIGTSLCGAPVTAIIADSMDYGTVRRVLNLQPRLNGGARPADARDQPTSRAEASGSLTPSPPASRSIVAIKPVVDEPLGIAIAQAADAVVLCVEIGKSSLAAARRTIDLIGPDRMAGALVIR